MDCIALQGDAMGGSRADPTTLRNVSDDEADDVRSLLDDGALRLSHIR